MTSFDQVSGQDFGGELCPEALVIAQAFDDPNAPPVEQMDINAARRTHALEAYDSPIACEDTRVEDRQITVEERKLRVRIYTPQGDGPFPILVFAHGGCWTFCSLDSHDCLCHDYAHHAQCVVVSVDYALAPEAPYPHGLNDFHDAVVWCFEHADEIHGDAARIAVAGDSAGGNLSAVVAQRLQHHPQIRLSLQLLIYPICDAAQLTGGSLDRYASGYFFTRDVLAWTASLYTSAGYDAQHPEISPLHGAVSSKLAPALFIIAECDVLRDQAVDYAQILRKAGVEVQCNYYRGVPHAFMAMAG
jgi:acetyl esterase